MCLASSLLYKLINATKMKKKKKKGQKKFHYKQLKTHQLVQPEMYNKNKSMKAKK